MKEDRNMSVETLRKIVRSISNRHYKSPEDLYQKRTRFGQINEFFKHQIISSDRKKYSLPFLGNPFRGSEEGKKWVEHEETDHYNYVDPERQKEAEKRFIFMHEMIKGRISKDDKIVDVGANSGFYLDFFHKEGYTNLHGIDPQTAAVKLAKETRPYLNIKEGFFGPHQYDLTCDMLVFFGVWSRIPYNDDLFGTIKRVARKYVLIWCQESMDDFNRDIHVGMALKGFLCLEKRVVDKNFKPVGFGEESLVEIVKDEDVDPMCHSYFLFRRIEPRAKTEPFKD